MAGDIYWTKGGHSFLHHLTVDANYQNNRERKLAFLMALNLVDVEADKVVWDAAAVRALAEDLVSVYVGKTRKTRQQLLKDLKVFQTDLIEAEKRSRYALSLKDAETISEGYGFVLPTLEDIEKQLPEQLAQMLYEMLSVGGYTVATRVYLMTKIRKQIERLADAEYNSMFQKALVVLTREWTQENKKLSAKNLTAKKERNQVLYAQPAMDFIRAMVQRVDAGDVDAKDWRLVVWFLMLATGRRPVELCGHGSFSPTDRIGTTGKDGSQMVWWSRFRGQAKLKGRDDAEYVREVGYDVPLLCELSTVVKALEYLDALGYRHLTPDEVTQKVSKQMSDDKLQRSRVLVHLKTTVGLKRFYDCRMWYARWMLDHLRTPYQNEEIFLRDILGHGELDTATCTTYKASCMFEDTNSEMMVGSVV